MKKTKLILCGVLLCGLIACSNAVSETEVSNDGLVILQAYGTGGKDDGSVNRSFIELYNNTNNDITLDGYTINYTTDSEWSTFELSGEIKKECSYLIVGTDNTNSSNSYYGNITNYDLLIDLEMSNDYFSVCLLSNDSINSDPINLDSYIDMVGGDSDKGNTSFYETSSVYGVSKQKSIRRNSLTDTNDNSNDFEVIDFRVDGNWDLYKPYYSKDLSRDPIVEIIEEDLVVEQTNNTLLINQVYGDGGSDEPAVNRSYIQLYNNSDDTVDLSNYVIYYMNYVDTEWSTLTLNGTIDANSSYLIVGSINESSAHTGTITDEDADLVGEFVLNNKGFTICLLSSESTLTSVSSEIMELSTYVDMVGTGSATIYENNVVADISKQKIIVRTSYDDTNNNANDFVSYSLKDDSSLWDTYNPFK